jgi:mycothiol synthase
VAERTQQTDRPRPPTAADPAPVTSLVGRLDAGQVAEVLELLAAAAAHDGADPVAEDARLALRGSPAPGAPEVAHLLARAPGGDLLGYAQARTAAAADGAEPLTTVELLVHPAARGRGTGTALARALAAHLGAGAPVHAWSHTDSPAAARLAARHGLRRGRELWRMRLTLEGPADLPPLELPAGTRLRAFEPGRDEEAWLGLNARAFASHPEQGAWQRADLDARTAEPWFDPAGLLLLVDDDGLLAAHWTKAPDPADPRHGEVYVVAVDPRAQGRGLGRVATLAGLHHLAARGARVVDLYVDGDNAGAQRTYAALGFARVATDVVHEGRA